MNKRWTWLKNKNKQWVWLCCCEFVFTWCTLGRTATIWHASAFPASVNTCWHKASPALPPDAQSQRVIMCGIMCTQPHHTSAAYLQLISYRTQQNVTSESFCTNEEAFPSNPTPVDEQNDKEEPSILFKYQIKHKIKSK